MKKFMMMMVCVSLLAGCGNKDDNNPTNNNNGNTPNNNVTDSTYDDGTTNMSWYDNFEAGLKDKNIAYTSRSELDATTIGGTEGYRYVTENGNIDVYRFEDGSDFERIVKEKKIDIEGKSRNVEVNDHMIIVSDDLSDDVLNVFRGLK